MLDPQLTRARPTDAALSLRRLGETALVPIPYRPMRASTARSLPAGNDVACEVKVDGWRCCCELSNGRVRIWTRGGREWSAALRELRCVSELGDDVVLEAS